MSQQPEALKTTTGAESVEQYIAMYGFCNWQAQEVIRERDNLRAQVESLQASRQPQPQQGGGEDAARWQFVMDWGNKDFAVCKRVGVTGTCWEPIKTSGPVDDALATKERS